MNTTATYSTTGSGYDADGLTLTPLPSWKALADLTLRKGACGALCAHGCLTRVSSGPAKLHRS
ncbi:hypothetical protein AB0M92_37860 [Streptomyces sp. NPDC051582]|uniref:hypothetical protein n=1 Tax=Streptomyces sp. NPDC051582 TaxID=3155167 RepID=UPI003438A3A2